MSASSQSRTERPVPRAAVLLAVVTLGACGGRPSSETGIDLLTPDQVSFQIGNVTTDLVSAPAARGLDRLEYGIWPLTEPGADEAFFQIVRTIGRLAFFSADGDTARVEIEARAHALPGSAPLRLGLRLNRVQVRTVRLGPEWSVASIDLPTKLIRRGPNILELRPRPGRKQQASGARIRVRSLRFVGKIGRGPWPQRPDTITVEAPTAPAAGNRVVRIPSAGFFEAVALVPANARLVGRVGGAGGPAGEDDRTTAYVGLTDEQGVTRTLWRRGIRGSSARSRELDVSLEPWIGQLVRLRLGVSGPGNAVVEWREARILGASDAEPRRIEPIVPRDPSRSARLGRPDVFVILLDAARADAFSPWGGPHPTPAAERLSADGTAFSRALAPSPWTGQSVSAILTGYYADALGVGPWGSAVPPQTPTVAELLYDAGYRTVLWSQHPFYKQQRDLQRGFEVVEFGPRGDHGALPDLADRLVEDRPNFAFVHLLPPHSEYDPPPPWRGRYSSWYQGKVEPTARFLNSFPRRNKPASLSAADRKYIFDRYLENAAWADALVGDLLAQLERADRYRDAVVILLSDHGEAFLEHDLFLHSKFLYDELLRVPLVIKWPAGLAGAAPRWEPAVSLVDVVPTLVDGLGLGGTGAAFQGRSLLPAVFDGRSTGRPVYAVTRGVADGGRRPLPSIMLEIDGWKMIHDQLAVRSELFRPADDPREQNELSAAHPREAILLERALLRQSFLNRSLLQSWGETGPLEEMDPEVEEGLRALGYLD